MGNESSEVLLARLEERLRTLFENQEKENRSREQMSLTLYGLRDSLKAMDSRLKNVEESLAKTEPTIEEFITIKHKVVGAGIFGKWVWAAAGFLIGAAAMIKREVLAWLFG